MNAKLNTEYQSTSNQLGLLDNSTINMSALVKQNLKYTNMND